MKRICILPSVTLAEWREGKAKPKWPAIALVGSIHLAIMILAIIVTDIILGNGIRLSGMLVIVPIIVTFFMMENRAYRDIEQCEKPKSPNINSDHISGS